MDKRADYEAYEATQGSKQEDDADELDDEEEDEEDEQVEASDENSDDETDEEDEQPRPKKRKPAKEAKARPRSRAAKVPRLKVVWAVLNNQYQAVATYEYPKRKEAEEHAARLQSERKQTFFVQPVKEPIEEKKEE
jgi:hypothetical protein